MGRITVNRTITVLQVVCTHRFKSSCQPIEGKSKEAVETNKDRSSRCCCFPSKRLSMCLWKRERTSRLRMSRRPCRAALSRHTDHPSLLRDEHISELSTHEGIDMLKSMSDFIERFGKNLAEFIGEKYRRLIWLSDS